MAPVDLLDFDLIFAPQRIGLLRTKHASCEYVPKCHASVRHTTRSSRPEWLYSAAQPGRAVTTAPRHMTRPEQFNAGSGSGRSAVTAHNSPQAWLFLLSAAACGMAHLCRDPPTLTGRPVSPATPGATHLSAVLSPLPSRSTLRWPAVKLGPPLRKASPLYAYRSRRWSHVVASGH